MRGRLLAARKTARALLPQFHRATCVAAITGDGGQPLQCDSCAERIADLAPECQPRRIMGLRARILALTPRHSGGVLCPRQLIERNSVWACQALLQPAQPFAQIASRPPKA